MGTIQVPGRLSGRTYTIDIKGDTPSETEQARIRAFLEERESQFTQRYEQQLGKPLAEPDDGTALGRGWEVGKAGAYSRLGTATEYLGRGLGLESLVGTGQRMREEGDYEGFLESLRQPAPTTLQDVTGVGSALTYLGEGIGQSGPEMLAPLAATGIGTLVGGPAVGFGAGAVTSFPSFFGGNVQRQEAEVAAGRKDEVDVTNAIVGAVGQSTLNAIGDKLLLGGFLKPGQKWLTRTAVGAAEGAAVEIPTEIAQQIIERKQAGMPLDNDEAINEYINAGILGGVMGGGIRGATAGLGIDMERPAAPPSANPPGTPPTRPPLPTLGVGQEQGELFGDLPEQTAPGATVGAETDQQATAAPSTERQLELFAPEAGVAPDQRIGAGTTIDEDLAEARAIYEERLAIAEEGGADPEEAKRIAAQVAVNYVDSLQEETRKRLERFRNTMARVASPTAAPAPAPSSKSVRGVMQPDLPDSAYASEFGETVQKDLFAPSPAAPTTTPTTTPEETRPAVAKAEPEIAPVPEVEVPKTEAPKTEQVLTEETVDRLGVGKAKSANLRKLVGKPLTDTKVIRALDSWAQNDRATPENKALAVSLITGQPAVEPAVEAAVEPAPTPEVQDDTTTAEAQPETVGAGVESRGRGVEQRKPDTDVQPAEGAETPAEGGLGGDLSVPMGAPAAARAEPDTLSQVERGPLPTDLREPVIPDTFLTYQRGITSKPVRPSEAPASVADTMRKEQVMQRLVQFFMQRASEALKRYTTARGGINSPTTWKDYPDWMSLADQSKVVQLLGRLNRKEREKYKFPASEVEPLSSDAEAAHTYFSKTVRPVDAIDMMLDDLSADYAIYEGSLRPGLTEIEHRDLMMGTGSEVAKRALNWVRANLSPETNAEIDLSLKKQAEKNAVTENWIGTEGTDRVAGGRAARDAARKAQRAAAEESGYDAASIVQKTLYTNPLAALDQEMHYSVKAALNAGDLKGALRALAATTQSRELRNLANRFADLVGTTRVRVLYPGDPAKYIDTLPNAVAVYVQLPPGVDPDYENMILINGQTGMTNHVLMHEMAHAVTARLILENPNHPTVRQLEELLDILREKGPKPLEYDMDGNPVYSDEFYGLTSVGELTAEAYGRVAFGSEDSGLLDLMKRTRIEAEPTPYVEDVPLDAYSRFKEIIGNFFRTLLGRPTKRYPRRTRVAFEDNYTTAREEFQRLVDGLLSTAPQVLPDSVLQNAVVNPMVGRNVLNNTILNADTWSPAGRKRLGDLMSSSVPQGLRGALLGLLQLDWFNDLAGGYFPQIAKLKTIDDLRRGKINTLNVNVKPVLEDLLAYAQKSPELYATLAGIQGQATLAEVDPTRPVSDYGADQEKVRVWHDLNRQLNAADGTGAMRALFKKTRNVLRAYRTEVERVLKSRVKDITDDTTKQNQLFGQLMKKLDEENAIDPYFSLMRKGDYWLEYTAEDTTAAPVAVDPLGRPQRPTARFVQAFESPFALAQFRAQLEAKTDDQGNRVAWDFEENRRPISDMNREGYVPPSFVQGALNIIGGFDRPTASPEERAKIEEARDAIHSMFLRLTPDHSLLKSFIKRKGTRGFIGDITPLGVIDAPVDMVQALADKTSSLSYQLANIEYGGKIQRLINDAAETRNKLSKSAGLTFGEKASVDAYHDEFVARAQFAKNPQVSGTAQLARGVTFNMTLGFSIAGAVNNLMQIPMIGATELGGRYGMPKTMRELGFAMRALKNAGKVQRVLSYGPDGRELRNLDNVDNFGSIANYFEPDDKGKFQLRTDINIPAKLRDKIADLDVLAEVLANNGMLNASMSQEMLEAESGWLHKINRWGGFLMHHAERFNRQSMAIATYNLELAKTNGRATPQAKLAAAKKAVEIAERVNGTIGASTAPRFAQSAVGSVVFMFKRFGLHMARYIIGTANQALRGATPEDRAVARYQIIGMLGTTALFAGVQGLPFFSELMTIFNLFFTGDDEERPEVVVQKFLGEPYYHGALNYLLGIEIASRISMSGLIFRENKIEKDQSVLYDLFEMFGGPAVGVFMNTERGIELLSQGELYRGVEAMMPSVVKSVMKAGRFGTEGATTLRGDEVVPLTPADIVKQSLGYTPEAYARQQERVSGAKRIDEAVREKKRRLLRKYNMAVEDGDFSEVRDVLKEMREFSRSYPEDAITSETINRSRRSFEQRSQEMISGVSFTNSGRGRAEQYIGEFDQDTSLWGT